jgi:hypothetical protein
MWDEVASAPFATDNPEATGTPSPG